MFAIYVYIHEEDVFQDAQNKKNKSSAASSVRNMSSIFC